MTQSRTPEPGETKTCRTCNQDKPATVRAFGRSRSYRDGLYPLCLECHRKLDERRIARSEPRKASGVLRNMRRREADAICTHTAADIAKQYKSQKGRCYYCHAKVGRAYAVDHVVPLSRGGSNGAENLVIACRRCNLSKGDKLPHEWPEGGRLL